MHPLVGGAVDSLHRTTGDAAGLPGDPVDGGGPADGLGLAVDGLPGVGGVAQHGPDHGAVPAGLAGAGGCSPVGQPSGQVGDRVALVGVAAVDLADQDGFVRDDLVARGGVRGLAQVLVAVGAPDSTFTLPVLARWALPRRYRSMIWAFSYSANMPWNWTISWSSGESPRGP